MLKYVNYDIVFQEFPDEVTLAINLSCCPNGCPGCHSDYLQRDTGEELTAERLLSLLSGYAGEITCVGLMGGDNDPGSVMSLCAILKKEYVRGIKTGWYSGREELPPAYRPGCLDYVKLGAFRKECGPLSSRTTNQRLYRIKADDFTMTDITSRFWRK